MCSDDYDESETEESESNESETSNNFDQEDSGSEISEDLIFNDDEMDDFINF